MIEYQRHKQLHRDTTVCDVILPFRSAIPHKELTVSMPAKLHQVTRHNCPYPSGSIV